MLIQMAKAYSGKRPARYSSITNRLALMHILAVVLTSTVGAVLLYNKLETKIDQAASNELQSEIVLVRTLLSVPRGVDLVKQEMDAQPYSEDSRGIYLRIVNSEGAVAIESPSMTQVLPPGVFPPPSNSKEFRYRSGNGGVYLIKNARLRDPQSMNKGWRLQIGIDIAHYEAFAATLRNYLMVFALGTGFIALGSSIVVVRRGLKPFHELSATIRTITERHLHTRVSTEMFPLEMHSLIMSFNGMMSHLEESFERLSHYSGNLAHELRTPINSLMLEAEIALSRERTPAEYREVINSCLDECSRLSVTVDRLLFLARADGYHNDMLIEKLYVSTEVEDVVDYFSDTAEAAGVELTSSCPAIEVFADQPLFRRALSNLISNAIAHTPAGGRITVTAEREPAAICVTVTDTGRGVAAEHLPRLFDRYYQVEREPGRDPVGKGLGLAIVKAIMTMHGGSAAITSSPGKGTSATLRFDMQLAPVMLRDDVQDMQ